MKKTLLLNFLIALLIFTSSNSLRSQIKFKIENYATEDGLSHDVIRDIIKGKEGFMWFATWDGINRFDGKNFITYKAIAGDHNSLGNNRIDLIKEDALGFIWLKAYDNQIYRFDKKTETFLSIASLLGTNKIEFSDVFPDSIGNVWLTTVKKGIYLIQKKDNNQIKIISFKQNSKPNFAIISNQLKFVFVDKSNNLWVGSDKGLDCIIHFKNQEYKSKNILKNTNLSSFLAAENTLWFGTNNGELIKYNQIHKKYSKTQIANTSINSIIKSRYENALFLTTAAGELITFNFKTFKTTSKLKIAEAPVYKIYQDKTGLLWVEPDKNGVLKVDLKTKSIQSFSQKIEVSIIQLKNSYGIFEDNSNRVWVKLKGGGFGYYNPKTSTLDYFFNKPGDQNQKFSNTVSSLFFDPSGILWMSTNDGGINKIIFQKNNFQQQLLVPESINRLENEIRAVFADKKNRLWIASKAGKLKVFKNNQELNNLFINYKVEDIGLIYSIIEDTKGTIWLGTKGNGLFKATPVNVQKVQYSLQHFKADKNNPKSISSDLIYSILEDKNGRIWIGTYDEGINLVEENQGKIIFTHHFKNYPFEESNRVRYLAQGYKDQIWVATTNGLVTFDPDNYNPNQIKFSRYIKSTTNKSSLNSNDILFMYHDSYGKMWLSTAGGGLNLAIENKENIKFKNFTKENGLPSDFILSVVEDDCKNLWLATENGISKFNLQNQTFRNYDTYDGLLKSRFSEATSLKLQNGNLIMGCKNGYLNFDPKKIENKKSKTQMVFTNFEVNNKISNVKSVDFPLKVDINFNHNIKLDYLHNTISIYYTVLDYRSNNKQLYAYRLKGLDDNWHQVKNQKKATFTNLDPGHYEFEVKCLNTDLYSITPQKTLSFTISPPFWKTNWAYFLYAILFLALLEISRRIVYSMIQLRNKVVVEQKMTELKLSFFTNISHELRTPLTLIVNPINEIAKHEKLSPLGIEYIETTIKNTNRLVRFVNQLLDFRKVQSGKEELHIETFELVSFINETISLFMHIAYEKKIKIKTEFSSEQLYANLDKNKLDCILFNLLSNAIKFSPNDSTIIVELKIENESILKINIIDQGCGVDQNKLEAIFKLYYETDTAKNKNVGTGIGLALCKEYVDLHQGNIYAINNDKGGLTLSITIDLNNKKLQKITEYNLAEEEIIKTTVVNKLNQEQEISSDSNLPVVLIVEDNQELRTFLKSQLERFYRILVAENGKEGLEIASKKLPDLIVSDVMMPQMNGIQMLDALKKATETSHIPVILLTAKSTIENKIEGLNYGADYYITKPFETDFLLASIENLIKQRKKIFENLQSNRKTIVLEPSEIVITTKDEQFLKDIITLVEEGLTDPKFNIDFMASSQNMARVTFNRKFKSLTNMTPVEFVSEMRIKRAKQYLDAGETNIASIAYKVGFNGAGYFSTCFKEFYKISPTDYLKQK